MITVGIFCLSRSFYSTIIIDRTESSNRYATVAQRFERIVPKGIYFESLKSNQAPFRQKILDLGSGLRHQVGNTIHFMSYKMSEP
jgi:hypothetical protein